MVDLDAAMHHLSGDGAQGDARIGQQLGEYRIEAPVADGAMGRVYDAKHVATGDRVAVKVLHAAVAQDLVSVERFKREYETAAGFDHPHIVRVRDFGETADGSWYMAMEFLEGSELGQLLRDAGPLSLPRALRMLCQVAGALDHAHSFGVIHRDLKPDNLFLCDGDDLRILDFGSVKLQMEMGPKLTTFGTTLGSPYYMSPEQAMGRQDVDTRTDVFAVAAIFYEALTGKIAFEGDTVARILMKIVNDMPVPVSTLSPLLPAALDDVLERGLSKDKAGRHASVTELAADALCAFGLELKVDEVAAMPLRELEVRLKDARPPPAVPFGGGSAGGSASVGEAMTTSSSIPSPPTSRQGVSWLVGISAMGLVAVAVWMLLK